MADLILIASCGAILAMMAYLHRRGTRTWIAPGALMPLLWAALIMATAVAAPRFVIDPHGLTALTALVGGYWLGATLGASKTVPPVARALDDSLRRRLLLVGWSLTAVSIVGVTLLYVTGRARAGEFASVAQVYTDARYISGEAGAPLGLTLAAGLSYPAAFLLAFTVPFQERRVMRLLAVAPIAAAIAMTLVTTMRASVLFTGSFWLAGLLAAMTYQRGNVRVPFGLLAGAVIAAFVLPLGVNYVTQLREGPTLAAHVIESKSQVYLYGSVSAFTVWFSEERSPEPQWGAVSFPGVSDALGIREKVQGLYDAVATIDPYGSYGFTNVYSAWRPLVEDVGLFGALAAAMIFGFVAARAARGAAAGRLSMVILVGLSYQAIFTSSVVGPFAYNVLLASWFVIAAALLLPLCSTPLAPLLWRRARPSSRASRRRPPRRPVIRLS